MDSIASATAPVADPINAVMLPTFAFLAIVVTYLPLSAFYSMNVFAPCMIVIVLDLTNFMSFINAIIWPNDNWDSWWAGYGLCDIEGTLRYPVTLAFACALCCFSKSMAEALDIDKASLYQSLAMKRRKLLSDALFCCAAPVLQLALHYVVQSGRYGIVPVFGCADQIDNSWPTIVILVLPAPIFTLLNTYYASMEPPIISLRIRNNMLIDFQLWS